MSENVTNTNQAENNKAVAPCSSHCYADRLVDLIDGHMPLDDDERATIRKYAIEVFGEPLDFFFGQMQMHSLKMDGQHSYRFRSSGWPMTHCKGPNANEAVKSAIEEIKRERDKSA